MTIIANPKEDYIVVCKKKTNLCTHIIFSGIVSKVNIHLYFIIQAILIFIYAFIKTNESLFPWVELGPCFFSHKDILEAARQGVKKSGQFPTLQI